MKRADGMPPLVYWGLWGIRTRGVAMGFAIFSLILTIIIIPAAVILEQYRLIIFALVPLWYWYAIKWVDNNSTWESSDNS